MGEGDGSLPRRAPRPARALRAGTGPAADRRDDRPQPRLPDDRHQPPPPRVGRLPGRRRARLRRGAPRAARPVAQLGGLDAAARRALRARRRVLHRARRFDWSQDRPALLRAGDRARSTGPDAWHPDDALFVPLRSAAGEMLGILVASTSRSTAAGPTDERARPARRRRRARRARARARPAGRSRDAASARRSSTCCASRRSSTSAARVDEMLDAVCVGIREALGFEKVASSCSPRATRLLVPARGRRPGATTSARALARAAARATRRAARPGVRAPTASCCSSPERPSGRARARPPRRSTPQPPQRPRPARLEPPLAARAAARPRGPARRDDLGRRARRPPAARPRAALQALRAFANQAMSAVESARQLELMRHLAEHDPLTGLRNRRGLQEHIDAEIAAPATARSPCSSATSTTSSASTTRSATRRATRRCAGSPSCCATPPARAAASRASAARSSRSCCPGSTRPRAMACAERLRVAIQRAFDDFPRPLTASIGVAVSGPGADRPPRCCAPPTRALCRRQAARPRPLRRLPRRDARALLDALRDAEAARASSSRPRCCWPRRSTSATSAPRATRRPSATTPRQIARALGLRGGPRRARPRRRRAARHRQARRRRRDPAQARHARRPRVGRDAPPPRARLADPRARQPARHRRLGARAPRARRRPRLPARRWPARRSRSRRASSPSPTPTRR